MNEELENLEIASTNLCKAQINLAVLEGQVNFQVLMDIRRRISDAFDRVNELRQLIQLDLQESDARRLQN